MRRNLPDENQGKTPRNDPQGKYRIWTRRTFGWFGKIKRVSNDDVNRLLPMTPSTHNFERGSVSQNCTWKMFTE